MNLFMHNLTRFQIEVGDTLKDPRFRRADGTLSTYDVIVANPPYSLKWKPWTRDPRVIGGVAPPVHRRLGLRATHDRQHGTG